MAIIRDHKGYARTYRGIKCKDNVKYMFMFTILTWNGLTSL